eukprot:3010777-Amphidinium_carterae.1
MKWSPDVAVIKARVQRNCASHTSALFGESTYYKGLNQDHLYLSLLVRTALLGRLALAPQLHAVASSRSQPCLALTTQSSVKQLSKHCHEHRLHQM